MRNGLTFYYWEPNEISTTGHCALKIRYQRSVLYVSWWLSFKLSVDQAVEGVFCDDEYHDSVLFGLREITLKACKDKGLLLPPGFTIFDKLYEILKKIPDSYKTQSRDAIHDYLLEQLIAALESNSIAFYVERYSDTHSPSDKTEVELTEPQSNYKKLSLMCGELAKYYCSNVRDVSQDANKSLLKKIASRGKCSHKMSLNEEQFSIDEIYQKALQLKRCKDLKWAVQVGAWTDKDLADRRSLSWLRFISCFPGTSSVPGIKGYDKGSVRHNCASMILLLLQVGRQKSYATIFEEYRHITQAFKRLVRLSSQVENDEALPQLEARLKKAEIAGYFSRFFHYVSQYSYPISEMCGTVPEMAFLIVQQMNTSPLISAKTVSNQWQIVARKNVIAVGWGMFFNYYLSQRFFQKDATLATCASLVLYMAIDLAVTFGGTTSNIHKDAQEVEASPQERDFSGEISTFDSKLSGGIRFIAVTFLFVLINKELAKFSLDDKLPISSYAVGFSSVLITLSGSFLFNYLYESWCFSNRYLNMNRQDDQVNASSMEFKAK